MTSGRTPRLCASSLTIAALLTALVLCLVLVGPSAWAEDTATTSPPAEEPTVEVDLTLLALNSATDASSSLLAHQPGDAVDGSLQSHWAAISRNYPQWFQVDLGAPHRVVKSSISWLRLEKSRKYSYRLEGSLDGEEWQLLADRSKKSAFNRTNDSFDVVIQYIKVTVLGANRGRAGIKEIRIKGDDTKGDEWAVVTPTPEPSSEPTTAPTPEPTTSPTPTPTEPAASGAVSISSLSASHATIGASVTITGTGFGSSQGDSKVTFGERLNEQGWAPCARTASITSWSDTRIVCTVPAMSPGKAGEPDTYHSVYVTVGGEMSNLSDFYIDPVTTITTGTSTDTAYTVIDGTRQTWIPSTGTVTSGHSMGVWPRSGAADVLFDGVTFTSTNQYIDAHVAGALTLGEGRSHKRLTFLNCTFTGNQGQGGTNWYGVTGVKFWNNPPGQGDCTDISFIGCDFGTEKSGGFSGMGIEQVGSVPSPRTAIIGCAFEGHGSGSEPISFGSTGPLYALVADCVIKGMGDAPRTAWRFVFESNEAHYIEFRDSEIWHFSGTCFNLNQRDSDGVPATSINPHILIKNVDVDFSRIAQANTAVNGKHGLFALGATSYVQFLDCTFNTGDADHYLSGAGSASPYWEAPNFRTCQYTDFTGSTIEGHVSHSSWPVAPYVPTTALGYWEYANNIHPTNIMPALAR